MDGVQGLIMKFPGLFDAGTSPYVEFTGDGAGQTDLTTVLTGPMSGVFLAKSAGLCGQIGTDRPLLEVFDA